MKECPQVNGKDVLDQNLRDLPRACILQLESVHAARLVVDVGNVLLDLQLLLLRLIEQDEIILISVGHHYVTYHSTCVVVQTELLVTSPHFNLTSLAHEALWNGVELLRRRYLQETSQVRGEATRLDGVGN